MVKRQVLKTQLTKVYVKIKGHQGADVAAKARPVKTGGEGHGGGVEQRI